GRTPRRHDAHRLLPAAGIPGLRDLLDDAARGRGDGQQLPPARFDRLRPPGEMGRLAVRLAASGYHGDAADQGASHLALVSPEGRAFGRPRNRRALSRIASRPDRDLGAARGGALGPAHGTQLAAVSAAAEEPLPAIGFESRHRGSRRHVEPFQDISRPRVDAPELALVALPGAVPEFAFHPGNPGDEAVGLDGAQDRPGLGIDLMDLALPILSDPKRPFGPGKP